MRVLGPDGLRSFMDHDLGRNAPMLIKTADDQSVALAMLDRLTQGSGPHAMRASLEVRHRRALIRGSAKAASLIDADYSRSPDWAVIHDLYLQHGGQHTQIDHLLINRWMDVYVLDSSSFDAGLRITEEGEFLRWDEDRATFQGIASPVNTRRIGLLRDAIAEIAQPALLGMMRVLPSYQSLVLVSPTARLEPSRHPDSSRVITPDRLGKLVLQDIDQDNVYLGLIKAAAKTVPCQVIETIARRLTGLHRKRGETPEQVLAPDITPPALRARRRGRKNIETRA